MLLSVCFIRVLKIVTSNYDHTEALRGVRNTRCEGQKLGLTKYYHDRLSIVDFTIAILS